MFQQFLTVPFFIVEVFSLALSLILVGKMSAWYFPITSPMVHPRMLSSCFN
jgi:hypothetical protein